MARITYVSGTDGTEWSLEGPQAFAGTAAGMRSYGWGYELASHGIANAGAVAREVQMELVAAAETADGIAAAWSSDLEAMEPGTVTVCGWSQRCLFVGVSTEWLHGGNVGLTATCVLLDGWWWREQRRYFPRGTSSGGIDHPYDYPNDLGHDSGRAVLENESVVGAPARIKFWGPCVNPYVVVGDNRYEADAEVRTGHTLVLDGTGAVKSATLYDEQGNGTNVFLCAVREEGAQAFAPLALGSSEVTWAGTFAFEVVWRERRAVPPWDA